MAESEKKQTTRTVLIAIDGSENASHAFEFYINQVRKSCDRVIVLHAFELPPIQYSSGPCLMFVENMPQDGGIDTDVVMTFYEEWSQMVKEQREEKEAILRSYEIKLKELQLHHEIIMVVGKPAGEVICKVAKDENADLVVLGTRGQGVIRRTFMGSVSDYVVHHAHIPVNVVPLPQEA